VEDGRGVLVAAPTGSGKTVVGEIAVHLALERTADLHERLEALEILRRRDASLRG
jgi:replicative superfamily II helicase